MAIEEKKVPEENSENLEKLVCSLFKLIFSVGVEQYIVAVSNGVFGLSEKNFKPDMTRINSNLVNEMEHILERIKKGIVAEEVVNESKIRELSERLEELNLQIREDGINANPQDIDEMTNILKQIKKLK